VIALIFSNYPGVHFAHPFNSSFILSVSISLESTNSAYSFHFYTVREDLKTWQSNFHLGNSDAGDGGKPIQVVTNRNKSPPVSQTSTAVTAERNVVTIPIVSTLSQNKFTTSGPATAPQSVLGPAASVATTTGSLPSGPTTQVGLKQPTLVLQQPAQYQQTMQMQQRTDSQILLHQAHPMAASTALHPTHHPQSMQPPPQQTIIQQKQAQKLHQVPQHSSTVLPAQTSVQIQQHPTSTVQQTKTVIPVQNPPMAGVAASVTPQPMVTQSAVPHQGGVTSPQGGVLPMNMHSRPPLQSQPPLKNQTTASSELSSSPPTTEGTSDTDSVKGKDNDAAVDDVSQRVKNVRLNPDAKEYIPAVKPFTSVSVSMTS
jgi:hypothetical protein